VLLLSAIGGKKWRFPTTNFHGERTIKKSPCERSPKKSFNKAFLRRQKKDIEKKRGCIKTELSFLSVVLIARTGWMIDGIGWGETKGVWGWDWVVVGGGCVFL